MLWIDVNKRAILNVYKELHTPEIIDYVTYLAPFSSCLVGGDFNVWHNMFKLGVADTNKEGKLAAWSSISGIDYIENLRKVIHNAGHILDLSFLNIPFVTISIQTNMHYASDHKVQVIVILGKGKVLLEQAHYRISKAELSTFLALVQASVVLLPKANNLFTPKELDKLAAQLVIALGLAIKTVGKPDRGAGLAAPW
jgi:hypothetical protein